MSAYLFDFDGTLVDSMPTYVSIMIGVLDRHGIPYGEDLMKIVTPLGYRGSARYFRSLGVPETEEQMIASMTRQAIGAYTNTIPAKLHTVDTLQKLKNAGHSLHILTASPHIALDPCLDRLGMTELFTNIWSCDDFATTKADPSIYLQAARRIGVSVEQVLFLDDNFNAVSTAKTAGMRTCGVYDDTSAEYEDEMRHLCDFYIRDFSEILQLSF